MEIVIGIIFIIYHICRKKNNHKKVEIDIKK